MPSEHTWHLDVHRFALVLQTFTNQSHSSFNYSWHWPKSGLAMAWLHGRTTSVHCTTFLTTIPICRSDTRSLAHYYLFTDTYVGIVMWNVAMQFLWNVLSLFVYQPLSSFSHPYICQISFRDLFNWFTCFCSSLNTYCIHEDSRITLLMH